MWEHKHDMRIRMEQCLYRRQLGSIFMERMAATKIDHMVRPIFLQHTFDSMGIMFRPVAPALLPCTTRSKRAIIGYIKPNFRVIRPAQIIQGYTGQRQVFR